MPSVLKSLLDNISSKISVNTSNITEINNRLNDVDSGTTLEEYITTNNSNISKLQSDLQSAGANISSIKSDVAEISSGLTSVRSEVTTARGGSASLDARLDTMTTATENAQSVASSAQNTANEAASSANTANSDIAAAADTFDSLKARLDDMTENITNVTADVSTNTDDISDINTQLNTARGTYPSLADRLTAMSMYDDEIENARGTFPTLGERIDDVNTIANSANTTANTAIKTAALLRFSSIGKFMNTTAMSSYNGMSVNNPYYFDANGNTTSQTNSVITFTKYANNPMFFDISISNILTVTTDDLIAPTSPITITVQGVIYNVYFIMLPYSTFNPEALDTICIMEPSPFIITNNPQAINVESIGSLTNTPVLSTTEAVRAYIPVLRPATNPGTIFRFLTTAIDPDTNTVQYYFSNTGFAFGL